MAVYKISVTWEESGVLDIEANNLFDAIRKAGQLNDPLTFEGEYVDHSLQVDRAGIFSLNSLNSQVLKGILKGLRSKQSVTIGEAEVKKWKADADGGIFLIRDLKTWSMHNVHGITSAVDTILRVNK